LTKITGDCPHCKKQVELDQEKLEFVKREAEKNRLNNVSSSQTQILEKPEVKEVIKEKIIQLPPSFMPTYKCKDGKCGKMHPNDYYTEPPTQKCDGCDQFAGADTKVCPWCEKKDFSEVTQEDRNDLGIPEPIYHHEHEGE